MVTLMTGTAMAQALPIAASPILTRLYTPADFGVLALFMAVTSVFGTIACGRYELAIQLADDEVEAINLAALSLLIAVALSVILLLLVLISRHPLARLLGNEAIAPWLFLVPVSVFLSGLTMVLTYLNSRGKRFKDIATAGVMKSVVMVALQAAGGFFKLGHAGLVVGQITSMLASNARLFRNATQGHSLRDVVTWSRMGKAARRHIEQPKLTLFGGMANVLSLNAASVLISHLYTPVALGHYALVQRVLAVPATLIGTSVGQVFFQRASESKRKIGTARSVFLKTSIGLLLVALPIYSLVYFAAEPVFVLVFGEPWRLAGRFAETMSPLFAARFIVSPVSTINQVYKDNMAGMLSQFAFLLASVGAIIFSSWLDFEVEAMLQAYVIVMVVMYSGYYLYLFRATR